MALKSKTTGLGRGLNAIFDFGNDADALNNTVIAENREINRAEAENVSEVDIELIEPNPNQPRKYFDDELIDELCQSIKSLGIIQPLTVREADNGTFVIISGERRYRAAQKVGLKKVPVFKRVANDEKLLEMALVENIQRENLNPLEIASSFERLLSECNLTQDELSVKIGKNRATISNYIRLLKLAPSVQVALRNGVLSMGHAKSLLAITENKIQEKIAEKVVADGLSVRETERIVRLYLDDNKNVNETKQSKTVEMPEYYAQYEHKLGSVFGQKITINRNNKGESKIVISFKSDDEIENLINKIGSI